MFTLNLFLRPRFNVFRGSSMAEHAAVNRRVVGSNPTWGAKHLCQKYSLVRSSSN